MNQGARDLVYILSAAEISGLESIVAPPYRSGWTLELSEPPWPAELSLLYEVPRVFYGHREQVGKPIAEPGG